ncbi:hypothetical protein PG984_007632 [Apiospora sp. TS-2023a]
MYAPPQTNDPRRPPTKSDRALTPHSTFYWQLQTVSRPSITPTRLLPNYSIMWLAATDLPRLQLCEACSGFSTDSIGQATGRDVEHVYTRTRGEVERAAISGCVFCDSVFEDRIYTDVLDKNTSYSGAGPRERVHLQIRNEERHPGLPPPGEQLQVRIKREKNASSLSITYRGPSPGFGFKLAKVTNQDADDPAKHVVQREAYIMSPGSPELLKKAQEWMNDCLANHTGCGRGGSTRLPTRVVLLSPPGEPPWAKVWEPNGQDGQYCALSYCWGRDQEHKILASRHERYSTEGLPYAQLPKTITDAFHIARSMGLRYIWIDSLCIVQDDRADKEREMANMMNIYRNATFTVSAASASDVTEGIFRTPHELRIERGPYYHPIRTDDGQTGSVILARIARYVAAEPINNRGWTFQESLLTPRLLIFTELMMAWKCHVGFQPNNLAPNGRNMLERRPSAGAWGNWFKHLGYTSVRLGVGDEDGHPDPATNTNETEDKSGPDSQVLKLWHAIVEKYTRRSLSEHRDRLPALSAIAQALMPRFQCQYHAGLWDRFLVLELTWNVIQEPSGRPSFKSAAAAGPSWSWASVVGACCDYRHSWMHNLRAEVVSCHTTLVSEDNPYGEVAAGELVLRGYLQPVRVVRGGASSGCLFDEDGQVYEASEFYDDEVHMLLAGPRNNKDDGCEAWCLLLTDSLGRLWRSGRKFPYRNTCVMMVLVKVGDGKEPRYRRVGIAKASAEQPPFWWEVSGKADITIV